jgi:hypothetical protein
MQREAEMEKRASEAARYYYRGYERPYYPVRSAPRGVPGGYGYRRQGPPAYYPPQGRPWGYPPPAGPGGGLVR